jgi:hypothetical protein
MSALAPPTVNLIESHFIIFLILCPYSNDIFIL